MKGIHPSGRSAFLLLITGVAACFSACHPKAALFPIRIDAFWAVNQSPERIGKRITLDLLARDGFMMYRNETCEAVHYAEACAGFGAARLAGLMKDSSAVFRLSERYKRVIEEGFVNTANHVDVNVYGILPLELFRQAGDSAFFRQGMELADGQWESPLPDGLTVQTRYWIDDVWMIGSLQVQAYRATGKKLYLDRAAMETEAYLKRLQQPNGLFHHGTNAPFFWGRGNGWVAAGLAELLMELPQNHARYPAILDGYVRMMRALLSRQSDSGMWRQLIDNEESWEETSSTAMFGYAMTVGVRKGILPKTAYAPACRKAWLALVDHVNGDGKISGVCVGTGKSDDVNHYLNRPRITGDLHGQAPMLWFAFSLLD
jgi:unsaturated rhamnogalacturonyl hydrolase